MNTLAALEGMKREVSAMTARIGDLETRRNFEANLLASLVSETNPAREEVGLPPLDTSLERGAWLRTVHELRALHEQLEAMYALIDELEGEGVA